VFKRIKQKHIVTVNANGPPTASFVKVYCGPTNLQPFDPMRIGSYGTQINSSSNVPAIAPAPAQATTNVQSAGEPSAQDKFASISEPFEMDAPATPRPELEAASNPDCNRTSPTLSSPAYSATSPRYSPTSPCYSPESPMPSSPEYSPIGPRSPAAYLKDYNRRAALLKGATVAYSPTDPYYDYSRAGKPYSPPSAAYFKPDVNVSPKYMVTNHPLFTKPTPPRLRQPDSGWAQQPPPPLEAKLPPPAPPLNCDTTCQCEYCVACTPHAGDGESIVMKELAVKLEPKVKQEFNGCDYEEYDMSVEMERAVKKPKLEMDTVGIAML
jgi:hypothetical protein